MNLPANSTYCTYCTYCVCPQYILYILYILCLSTVHTVSVHSPQSTVPSESVPSLFAQPVAQCVTLCNPSSVSRLPLIPGSTNHGKQISCILLSLNVSFEEKTLQSQCVTHTGVTISLTWPPTNPWIFLDPWIPCSCIIKLVSRPASRVTCLIPQ